MSEYPVFESAPAASTCVQGSGGASGGGGGGGGARVLFGIAIGVGAILAIGFSVVKLKDCKDGSDHEQNEGAQRKDREAAKECERDAWGTACAEYKRRHEHAAQDAQCDADRGRREKWIQDPTDQLSGYAPATMQMSAVGACGETLRVREKDCSLGYLAEAYGDKPFMKTARRLGFRKLSCGYDEFDLATVAGH